jgi:hypothetical protein
MLGKNPIAKLAPANPAADQEDHQRQLDLRICRVQPARHGRERRKIDAGRKTR